MKGSVSVKKALLTAVRDVGIYTVLTHLAAILREESALQTAVRRKMADDIAKSIERARDES